MSEDRLVSDKYPIGSSATPYHDEDGNQVTLIQLVRKEPEWARSRIKVGEQALVTIVELEATIKEMESDALNYQKLTDLRILVKDDFAREQAEEIAKLTEYNRRQGKLIESKSVEIEQLKAENLELLDQSVLMIDKNLSLALQLKIMQGFTTIHDKGSQT